MSTPDFKRNTSVNGRGSAVITGWELIRRQFLALFIKRFHHARRSRKGLIAQVMASVCHIDELKGYTSGLLGRIKVVLYEIHVGFQNQLMTYMIE